MNETTTSLAYERSTLAWHRTALAAFAAAVLFLKLGLLDHRPFDDAAAGTALLVAILAGLPDRRRQPHPTVPLPGLCLLVAVAAVATGGLAFAGAMTGP